MKVVVETPKFSFRKYEESGGGFRPVLTSPLPTLFNYGFVPGSVSGDGKPVDVLVLGGRLPQGSRFEARKVGVVGFVDDGVVDDKIVASGDGGRVSGFQRRKILVFFHAYSLFKKIRCLFFEGRVPDTRFTGLRVQ